MPVWGTVLLAGLVGWLVMSVVVALAVGRAIRIAERRTPRKPHTRTRSSRRRAIRAVQRNQGAADAGDRRRERRGPG